MIFQAPRSRLLTATYKLLKKHSALQHKFTLFYKTIILVRQRTKHKNANKFVSFRHNPTLRVYVWQRDSPADS